MDLMQANPLSHELTANPSGKRTRIPKIIHFTFGMAKSKAFSWGLVHYVCLRSAIERIKPDRVYMYYEYEPTGPWWELSRGLVELVPIRAPREIYGNPLKHFAHRSDIVRLLKLIEHGGIYLDADVFVQRSFDELLNHSAVLGPEGENIEIGLSNAVILAEQNAPFLVRWLEQYHSFRGEGKEHFYNEHSVKVPAMLARVHPSEITVLPHTAFAWPLWTKDHQDWVFNSTKPIPLEHTYANHLFESQAARFIENLTPADVRGRDTNFHLWARPFIADLPDHYGAPTRRERLLQSVDGAVRRLRRRRGTAVNRLRRVRRMIAHRVMGEDWLRRRAFQQIYRHHLWGNDGDKGFYSGPGSVGPAAELYVECLAELLQLHAKEFGRAITVVDIGCGDFRIGGALVKRLPDITYIGCDIVPELVARNNAKYGSDRISFCTLDVVRDPLPKGDVCLIRQVFQHLSNADILKAVARLRYPVVYVTEGHPAERLGPVNPDKRAGADVRFNWRTGQGRGVELDQSPFCLETREILKCTNSPGEVVITERVKPPISDSGQAPTA